MRVAFIGCGYAADFYATSLKKRYPQLELGGVFDKSEERATKFSRHHSVSRYDSMEELLEDDDISVVINLTNIKAHFQATKACLEAKKHVYSEKPLAMSLVEAEELVALAINNAVHLACAPANVLGEAVQTVWKLLRNRAIGDIWLVYAEMDDGAIHQMNYHNWQSTSGTPWPFEDEFAMGCTLEHAEYQLGPLTTFFGPARQVYSFSSCLVPNKIAGDANFIPGDDLSITCIKFSSGVVARLTCSTLAPKNHSITIVGSDGVLILEDCWRFDSPVFLQERLQNTQYVSGISYLSEKHQVKLENAVNENTNYSETNGIDFARGIIDLVNAIQHQRNPRLSAQQALHITEVISSIKQPSESSLEIRTSFEEVEPMPWAK